MAFQRSMIFMPRAWLHFYKRDSVLHGSAGGDVFIL